MPGEYNAKILQYTMGMDYRLFSKKPVRTLEDLKGMKIKAMGAYANWVKALGGEGVPVPIERSLPRPAERNTGWPVIPLRVAQVF